MLKIYKCVIPFQLYDVDENGMLTENCICIIKGSVWQLDTENKNFLIGDYKKDVCLERIAKKRHQWIEIDKERLITCFAPVPPRTDKDGWIPACFAPTMEQCQKNDTRFIVTDGMRVYFRLYDYENHVFGEVNFSNEKKDDFVFIKDECVTYWQELPNPPKK